MARHVSISETITDGSNSSGSTVAVVAAPDSRKCTLTVEGASAGLAAASRTSSSAEPQSADAASGAKATATSVDPSGSPNGWYTTDAVSTPSSAASAFSSSAAAFEAANRPSRKSRWMATLTPEIVSRVTSTPPITSTRFLTVSRYECCSGSTSPPSGLVCAVPAGETVAKLVAAAMKELGFRKQRKVFNRPATSRS